MIGISGPQCKKKKKAGEEGSSTLSWSLFLEAQAVLPPKQVVIKSSAKGRCQAPGRLGK